MITSLSEGRLECVHCGQTFLVRDGDNITIDHFRNCPGKEGGASGGD